MVSAEFECGPVGVSMMQTSAAPGDSVLSPASAEASYLRGMAASVAASGASPYPHPESILPHSHHPHMQVRKCYYLWQHCKPSLEFFSILKIKVERQDKFGSDPAISGPWR